jgi:hypothetical protein
MVKHKCIQHFDRNNLNGKDHYEVQDVNGITVLKCILEI